MHAPPKTDLSQDTEWVDGLKATHKLNRLPLGFFSFFYKWTNVLIQAFLYMFNTYQHFYGISRSNYFGKNGRGWKGSPDVAVPLTLAQVLIGYSLQLNCFVSNKHKTFTQETVCVLCRVDFCQMTLFQLHILLYVMSRPYVKSCYVKHTHLAQTVFL